MINWLLLLLAYGFIFLSALVRADESTRCEQDGSCADDYIICEGERCRNLKTDAMNGGLLREISFTPVYENHYQIDLLRDTDSCEDGDLKEGKVTLPKNSYFRRTLDYEAQTPNEIIVHVYEVDKEFRSSLTAESSAEEKGLFDAPYKLCLNGTHRVQKSFYKRIGGVNTGILVVPFKFRQGDIFSDSTIGPYISYQWEVIELVATAGLSQISVTEVGSDEVESKTGLTGALGVSFEIDTNWDIAILAGVDRLSGSSGDDWKYQDEIWWSFAIGFNFTREE